MREVHGWGRYPHAMAEVSEPRSASECALLVERHAPLVARGLGRSYGDSALAARLLATRRLDRFRTFDPATGELTCEAGVSLDDILQMALPRGWFLPVTPGTRFVSVGGAIASDVHGKDHHMNGTFGSHVRQIELLLGNGELVRVSPGAHAELFRATCGGMGLTGVIVAATLQLKPVSSTDMLQTTMKLPALEALLEAFAAEARSTYSVAWIDCLSGGAATGRSVLILGEHAPEGSLRPPRAPARRLRFDLPRTLLNRATAHVFNALYYGRTPGARTTSRARLESFFYPLDAVQDWNRCYGTGGFVQYQFVLPNDSGLAGLREILKRIKDSGQAPFLGVLKQFGPDNGNPLSFPRLGYTLAVDFKAEPAVFELLAQLDAVVLHHGGALYLAKDARMSPAVFRRSYPRWMEFEEVRARWQAHGRFASAQSRRLGLL